MRRRRKNYEGGVSPYVVDANRWAVVCSTCGAGVGKACWSMHHGKVTDIASRRTHGDRLLAVRRMLETQ